MDPAAPVSIDTRQNQLLLSPNIITTQDMEAWRYARCWCSVALGDTAQTNVLLKSNLGGIPLLVEKKMGRGSMILVAINIEQQLVFLHRGSMSVLANIISNPRK
jgi:hypothetical protein